MWISDRDTSEQEQSEVLYNPETDIETSFGDAFAASVGHVVDEELSVSSALNNEGYSKRREMVRGLVEDGFDIKPYQDDTGFIDYDRVARETEYGVQTDRELYDARNSLLEQKRSYSKDVMERGSGMAQFLGSMTGYMLDPVNVVTLPLGASASALRGLSTLGRVATVAGTETAIATATELAIQPLVYAHKNEIGSPYEVEDAIAAIATAAIGGAAMGGAAAGIAGFARRVAKLDLPDTPEVRGSREILERVARDVEANPERMVQSEALAKSAKKFQKMNNTELARRIETLKKADVDGSGKLAIEAAEAVQASRKGRWAAKVEAERLRAVDEADVAPDVVQQDLFPKRLQEELGAIEHRRLVETDAEYLKKLESTRMQQSEVLGRPETYGVEPEMKAQPFDEFEAEDLARYDAMEADGVVYADGEQVSAKAFIDERQAEVDGLEQVRVCAYG